MGQLAQVLRGVSGPKDERLLVGPETFDDAGVVALRGVGDLSLATHTALVQTVDYFPPVVDDPYFYGAIAAANALSDVYAMGGTPLSALNIAGLPRELPPEWTAEIFRGGFETMRAAGCVVAGGHTVQSKEALFGFAVTGVVDDRRIVANSGARPGDVLYLTKALGMGVLTTAAKQQKITWADLEPAARQMASLNDRAAAAMQAANAHACTDITGFGLIGHAQNIAAASHVTIRLHAERLPVFAGALELARAGTLSGGSARNRAALQPVVLVSPGVEEALAKLVFDAETSGGLLIAVAREDAPRLEDELARRGLPVRAVGTCGEPSAARIELVPS